MVHPPNTKRRFFFLVSSLPFAAATARRMPQTTKEPMLYVQ
jgi:hypothetical protein